MQIELNQLIEALPGLGWTALSDGRVEYLNRGWLDYAGMTAEQAAGWAWTAVLHRDDQDALLETWQSALASGAPVQAEARMRRYDGRYRWFLIHANPLRDEEGNVTRWFGNNIDIEDRKRAEEALRASEHSMRQVVDNIPGLVATLSATGEVEFINRQMSEYFGRSLERVRNDWALDIHPDDLPRLLESRAQRFASGQATIMEYRIRNADGVYRWFQAHNRPARNPEGTVTAWYVLFTDIDDRKKAGDALQASERALNLTINAIPTYIHVQRTDGSMQYVNQAVLDYFGLTLEDMQKDEYRVRVIHPEDFARVREERRMALARAIPFENEQRVLRKDGTYRWFLIRWNPLLDSQGRVVRWYGASFDIEDRKRAEMEVERARSELARVARVTTLNALTASIAHEVNQPLTGIITNASVCLHMLDNSPPNIDGARETARRMLRDGNRASDVIKRLRALYGNGDFTCESLDLNEAAHEVIALLSNELHGSHIVPQSEFAEDLPVVRGDRIQLQQVMLNLLRNAAEAMSEVADRPRQVLIRTEREENGDSVRLTVRDAGVGLSPHSRGSLFNAFHTTKSGGMGIGLFVSRSIIERHNGRLWAQPNCGAPGATFSFSIPCDAGKS